MFNFDIVSLLAGLPALIIAIVGHEYAHARVATWLGDPTPRAAGRLTLNPMAHLDPFGVLALFLVGFGWAKPVPVNIGYFRDRRTDELLVALAGPGSNILMAFIAYIVLVIVEIVAYGVVPDVMRQIIYLIVLYNVNFAIFNMLPIPPLDGSTIITAFLPWTVRIQLYRLSWISLIVFILLLNSPILRTILYPLQRTILVGFQMVVQLFL